MESQDHPLLSPRNFWFASVYLTVIGILGTLLVEILDESGVPHGAIAAALAGLCAAGGYLLSAQFRRMWRRWWKNRNGYLSIVESDYVRRAAGLIVLVSKPPGRSSALQAALYHAQDDILQHLWLVTAPDARADAEWVGAQLREAHPKVRIHAVELIEDLNDIPAAKGKVEFLRRAAIREHKIPEPELICDFTGLTKHASAGMILACAPGNSRLQYMHPVRKLADGRADPGAGSVPREVDIRYTVVEEE